MDKKSLKKCILCAIPNFETIQKNGKFKRYLNMNERYLNNYNCLIQGDSLFYEEANVDYENNKKTQKNTLSHFHGNFNYSKKIILTLLKLEKLKFNITYYKGIYIYKKKNINILSQYIYIKRFIYDPESNDVIKKLSEVYKLSKLRYPKLNESSLMTQLFFSYYVQSLIDEIEKKFGIDITLDFSNFNELYLFLKKKGYVDKYYKEIIVKIKENVKLINKKLKEDQIKINNLKIKILNETTNFDLGLDVKKLPYTNNKIKLIKAELDKLQFKK